MLMTICQKIIYVKFSKLKDVLKDVFHNYFKLVVLVKGIRIYQTLYSTKIEERKEFS